MLLPPTALNAADTATSQQQVTEPFTAQQQQRLDDILSGKVDKTQVEVVLARYDEDLSWCELYGYSPITTVYNKGEPILSEQFDVVPLENKGREGHT